MAEQATFGEQLRARRLSAGLTQEDLARRAAVSVRTVRDIEQGRVRQPRRESAQRLAAEVGLSFAGHVGVPPGRGAPGGRTRPDLEIGVLGPLAVRVGTATVDIGSAMQRSLLGLLAVQPNEIVSRAEIIDVLWGHDPPDSCLNLVHTYVARLRKLLAPHGAPRPGGVPRPDGGTIHRARGGYRLVVSAGQLDLLDFVDLATRARTAAGAGDVAAAYELAGQALSRWRGPLLSDVEERSRRHPAAVAVGQQRVAAALTHADAALSLGHPESAVRELRIVTHTEPLHEGLHARLMLALAGSGQQAAAVRLYHDLRERLDDQLGIEPGAEVRDAHLRVLRQQTAPPRPDRARPAPAAQRTVPAQLPADVACFTGRESYLRILDSLLPAPGDEHTTPVVVVTVTGMGGIGKTALVVHWAHSVRDRFPDGQIFIDLRGYAPGAPVRDSEALEHLLRSLGVAAEDIPAAPAQAAGLYRSLTAGRRVLVVLDNAARTDQVRTLLPGGPGCVVVVTSRDRLSGLVARDGARRLTLAGLTPDEARTLLVRTVSDGRAWTEPAAVAELAGAGAHLPLALRIAAANLSDDPHLGIAEYVDELRRSDRLGALAADGDAQAAVRAAFDLSYATLTGETRRMFRRLGLVPGPDVTVDAAAVLADCSQAEAGRLLRLLAGAHLVQQVATDRYGMHDLLRLYATERAAADDTDDVRAGAVQRLYGWYYGRTRACACLLYPTMLRLPPSADLAEAGSAEQDPAQASAWLDGEYRNLLAAVEHAARHGPRPMAWLLTDALRGYFWQRASPSAWIDASQAALGAAQAADDPQAEAVIQASFAEVLTHVSRYPEAMAHATEMLRLARRADWLRGTAAAHRALGVIQFRLGHLADAAENCRQALAIDRRLVQSSGRGASMVNLGLVYLDLGRLREAADLFAQALALHPPGGSRYSRSIRLSNLGEALHALGRLEEALERLTEALAIDRETGSQRCEAETLCRLAAVHRDAGDQLLAKELVGTAVTLARDTRDGRTEANALNTLASICHQRGDHTAAVRHHDEAVALARETGERSAEVAGLIGLALADKALGDPDRALEHALDALALARDSGYRVLEGHALTAVAAIHLAERPSEAARYARQALAVHQATGHHLGRRRAADTLRQATAADR